MEWQQRFTEKFQKELDTYSKRLDDLEQLKESKSFEKILHQIESDNLKLKIHFTKEMNELKQKQNEELKSIKSLSKQIEKVEKNNLKWINQLLEKLSKKIRKESEQFWL